MEIIRTIDPGTNFSQNKKEIKTQNNYEYLKFK